jgi:hypothetical protein
MSIIEGLKELKTSSDRSLPNSIITGMTQSLSRARYQLMVAQNNPRGAGFQSVPSKGAASLLQNVFASRKLMTSDATGGFMGMLNKELEGGESYPILNAVLGTVAGVASGGAALLFTVGTTALDVARVHQGVQVRHGDELWQVEEIGKVRDGSSWEVVHVGSYFVVDPFRRQTVAKGWLIHEERTVLTV